MNKRNGCINNQNNKIFLLLLVISSFIISSCVPQSQTIPNNAQHLENKNSPIKSEPENRILKDKNNLDSKLGKLTSQIVDNLSQEDKSKIAVVDFADLNGNITEFGMYISEELITRLFLTNKFNIVERNLLNKVISEQKLTLKGTFDQSSVQQLGEILGVDAIVSGTITDLGRSLKINARIISTKTGSIFAVASTKITKSSSVKNLLSEIKTSENKSDKKPDDSKEGDLKKTYEPGEICLQENFNSYQIGDPVSDWGSNLVIKSGKGGRKYLSSNIPGVHTASQKIIFPQNFQFEYLWSEYDNRESGKSAPYIRVLLKLYDKDGKILKIKCGNWGIIIPGLPNKDFHEDDINRFKMVKKGNVYKFYNDGRFLISNTYKKYSKFVKFEIAVPVKSNMEGQKFTDFKITCLSSK